MTTFRARAFQHWMARLALAAVLLLALAPTLSRAAAATAVPQALGAMCTADGLAPAAPTAAFPADPAGASSDAACDYCPLLAQVTPFSPVSLPMPSLHATPLRPHDAVAWPYAARAQAGLGARGPPPHA